MIVSVFLSFALNGSVSAQATDPPARPTGLSILESSHDSVTIEWTDLANNTITGYQIYRRNADTDPPNIYSLIESDTGNTDNFFTDDTVAAVTNYEYQIAAVNSAGISQFSTSVSVTTPDTPFEVVFSTSLLTVDLGNTDMASYTVRLSREPTGSVTVEITGHKDTAVTLDQTSLTFTTENWETAQTVDVSITEDDMDVSLKLSHEASGGDFDGVKTDLEVMVDAVVARLSSLTVSPQGIKGFTPGRTDYAVGMPNTQTFVTIDATPLENDDNVTYDFVDLIPGVEGHQAQLNPGINTFVVTVSDDMDSSDYTLTIGRGVTDAYGWKAVQDRDGLRAAGNDNPDGLWGDGRTLWVSDRDNSRVYAYTSLIGRDGPRRNSDEIVLDSENSDPTGIWSDGQTMWVADSEDDKLYAYVLTNGRRLPNKDITLDAENDDPTGIWSDGQMVWVADSEDDKLYAYVLTNGVPRSHFDFAVSASPQGHWSDGVTWWVAGTGGVFAWDRATGMLDSSKHLATTGAGNRTPRGVWSDGLFVMLVADETNKKVYSYNIPVSTNVDLRTLTVDGASVSGFSPDTQSYRLDVRESVGQITVSAEVLHVNARISRITPADANDLLDGHQVDIDGPSVDVSVTVSNASGLFTKTYTVTVRRTRGFVFSPASLDVVENPVGGASYSVRLSTEPSETVTVTVSGEVGTDVRLSGLTLSLARRLTFTTANWDTAQTVMVTAVNDADDRNDEVTLRHTAAGGIYDGDTADFEVVVVDNDRAILFSPASLDVVEGAAAAVSYRVAMLTEPSETVTVTVSGQSGTDLRLGGLDGDDALMFTTGDWDTAQTVTVTAVDDGDGGDDEVTLRHTVAGGAYDGDAYDFEVVVVDDDRAILFSPASLDVVEGAAAAVSYSVRLSTEPSETVTVTVSGQSGLVVLGGLDGDDALMFTTANWDTAQTVTVTAVDDGDDDDDEVTLRHTVAGGIYDGDAYDFEVVVVDDDRAILFSPASLDVVEGAAAAVSYSVSDV